MNAEFAKDFLTLGIAIVAFCITQTVGFLIGFSSSLSVVATLLRWRPYSTAFAVLAGRMYGLAVIACFAIELSFRVAAEQGFGVYVAYSLAFLVRLGAVWGVSAFYLRVFTEVCREEEQLIRDRRRNVLIPRIFPTCRTPKEKKQHEKALAIDRTLFGSEILDINHFYRCGNDEATTPPK